MKAQNYKKNSKEVLKCKILKEVKEHRSAENYKNARVGKSAKEC